MGSSIVTFHVMYVCVGMCACVCLCLCVMYICFSYLEPFWVYDMGVGVASLKAGSIDPVSPALFLRPPCMQLCQSTSPTVLLKSGAGLAIFDLWNNTCLTLTLYLLAFSIEMN